MVGIQKELAACSHSRIMGKTTTAVQMLTEVDCGVLPRKISTRTINGVTVEVSNGVLELTSNKSKKKKQKCFPRQSMAANTFKSDSKRS